MPRSWRTHGNQLRIWNVWYDDIARSDIYTLVPGFCHLGPSLIRQFESRVIGLIPRQRNTLLPQLYHGCIYVLRSYSILPYKYIHVYIIIYIVFIPYTICRPPLKTWVENTLDVHQRFFAQLPQVLVWARLILLCYFLQSFFQMLRRLISLLL